MSPGILGKKIGMTQVFTADGQVVPVTLVKAGPCIVTQRKTPATDGYDAIQLGLVEYAKKQNKPKHQKQSLASLEDQASVATWNHKWNSQPTRNRTSQHFQAARHTKPS